MTSSALQSAGRAAFVWTGLVLVLGLAACTPLPGLGIMGGSPMQASLQYTEAQSGSAWAAPVGGQVAITRKLGREGEQIIGLVNDTAIAGDNFLWMGARETNRDSPGRFKLDDLVTHAGGVPPPFHDLSDDGLHSGTDSLGPFFWLEYRAGPQTNCVLAVRRIDASRRMLPQGTNLLEVMLRNCIQGSIETALNPIRDSQIGVADTGSNQQLTGGSRMLSPLAAPMLAP